MGANRYNLLKKVNSFYQKGYLFECALISYLIGAALMLTAWYAFNDEGIFAICLQFLRYFGYGICCIVILLNVLNRKYSDQALLFYLVTGIIMLLTMFATKQTTLFLYFLILAAAYGHDINRCAKIACLIQGSVLLVTVILSFLGLAPDVVIDVTTRTRHTVGFGWVSIAPNFYVFFILAYVYLRKEKITWWEIIGLEAVNTVLFVLTDTKMPFFLVTAILLLIVAIKVSHNNWAWFKCIKKIGSKLVIIFFILSFAILYYKPYSKIWHTLNIFLSYRLSLGKMAVDTYGWTFFGRELEMDGASVAVPGWETQEYTYVDSSYVQIFVLNGIFVTLIAILIYTLAIKKSLKANDNYLTIILILICAFSVIAPFLLDIRYNIFLLALFCGKDVFVDIKFLNQMVAILPFKQYNAFMDKINNKLFSKKQI